MTKEQYIKELKYGLRIYPASFQRDILDAFEEHFNNGVAAGHTETEIMVSLGSVEEVLQNIRELEETPITLAGLHQQETMKRKHQINEPWSLEYEENTTEQNYQNCTSLHVSIPFGNCDVEICKGNIFKYDYESSINLFSNTNNFIHAIIENDTLILKPAKTNMPNSLSGKLSIHVTEMITDIQVSTTSGDIDVSDIQPETMELTSISGDIEVNQSECQDGIIRTTSGDIDVDDIEGNWEITSTSGDLELLDIRGTSFSATTTSGDIEYTGISEELQLKTVSGDIEATLKESTSNASMQTTSGDVEVELADDDYQIIVQTMSGDIDNETDMPLYRESKKVLRIGEGSCDLHITTLSGDITIR